MHAADGYARSSGKVGVVLVTSGPAPLIRSWNRNGIHDSVPLVVITDSSHHRIGTDAFQESDITPSHYPTKHSICQGHQRVIPALHEASTSPRADAGPSAHR